MNKLIVLVGTVVPKINGYICSKIEFGVIKTANYPASFYGGRLYYDNFEKNWDNAHNSINLFFRTEESAIEKAKEEMRRSIEALKEDGLEIEIVH